MSDPIELKPIGRSAPPLPPPQHPTSNSLHSAYRMAEEKAKAAVHLQEGVLDNVSVWGCVVASWFTLLAIPLLLFPRLLLFFSQTAPPTLLSVASKTPDPLGRDHYDLLTPLESYLAQTLSFALLAGALITLLVLVPSYDPPTTNPSRTPLLCILVGLSTLASLVAWNTGSVGALGKVLGGGNALVALWGWWVVVFGQSGFKPKDKSRMPKRMKKL